MNVSAFSENPGQDFSAVITLMEKLARVKT